MWEHSWRQDIWKNLSKSWDLIVIGGGITGAGIFRSAVAEGYTTLLVEAGDFASGTSSRSSKLVHGGFRYLRNKQYNVTRESVREREWMLKEARNLVTPLGFVMPCPADLNLSAQFAAGVVIYDLLAPKWKHQFLSKNKIMRQFPEINPAKLWGGFLYYDAEMDDARLVQRIIQEGVSAGGTAMNYSFVERLIRSKEGAVCGIQLKDRSSQELGTREILAKVTINATGPWSDELRNQVGGKAKLRKLRGSHLIFPREKLPLQHAVTLLHPKDHRGMFAIPWEGTTMIGTTDLDHSAPLTQGEPFATSREIEYILEAAEATFPEAHLEQKDILSTFSGLRPVINTGNPDPSKESRAHVVWEEEGLITVTGGKFTTFRIMAEAALQKAALSLPHPPDLTQRKRYFEPLGDLRANGRVLSSEFSYLLGRYGADTEELLCAAKEGENEPIGHLPNLWSEIRWNARKGAVEHLDDLLLRRVRIGMLLPNGAGAEMDRIKLIAQGELGWDEQKWKNEVTRYQKIIQNFYSPAPTGFSD